MEYSDAGGDSPHRSTAQHRHRSSRGFTRPGGYLLTQATATSIAGLYAAGDVTRATHQTVGSALADAVVAARSASAYLVGR